MSDENKELHFKHPNVYVALVHWPVLDRADNKVCTSVTNFDIHDIARACRTYGINKYFIVNRMQQQLMFVERIIDHWRTGYGKRFNSMRASALRHISTVETIQDAVNEIGEEVMVVATAARKLSELENVKFAELREKMTEKPDKSILLVFGTGFGLHPDALESCKYLLEPIHGGAKDEYNHLSVRSAVSICLDRLLSP